MGKARILTYHGKQGTVTTSVNDADVMVIAQPDNSTPSKYRTVNISLLQSYEIIKTVINTTPNLIKTGVGLIGDGTPSEPIRVDEEYLRTRLVNKKHVNVSQVGADPGVRLPMNSVGWVVNITAAIPAYLGGVVGSLPVQSWNISSLFSNPAGKTFYLNLSIENGAFKLAWSDSPMADRYDSTYIAKAVCGASGITNLDSYGFSRLDKYRVAEPNSGAWNLRGGSFPVSTGAVYSVGYSLWGSIAGAGGGFKLRGVNPGDPLVYKGRATDAVILSGITAQVALLYGYSGASGQKGELILSCRVQGLPTNIKLTTTGRAETGVTYDYVIRFVKKTSKYAFVVYECVDATNSANLTAAMLGGVGITIDAKLEVDA